MGDMKQCIECEVSLETEEEIKDELCEDCEKELAYARKMEERENFDIYGGDPNDPVTWFGNEPDVLTWQDIARQEQ